MFVGMKRIATRAQSEAAASRERIALTRGPGSRSLSLARKGRLAGRPNASFRGARKREPGISSDNFWIPGSTLSVAPE